MRLLTGTPGAERFSAVDVARGAAFVAMVVYHASWFAAAHLLVDWPVTTALGWRLFQKSIAGTFYALVGVSLVLAHGRGVRPGPWAFRMAQLLGAAAIVTVASYVLDSRSIVTYGILHNIAVCSVLGLLLVRLGPWSLLVAALAFAVDATVATPALDGPWVRWLGLGVAQVRTFDFQPLLPWFGVVAVGVALGGPIARAEGLRTWRPGDVVTRGLAACGRHSLFLYLAHVPVLVVAVEILARLSAG